MKNYLSIICVLSFSLVATTSGFAFADEITSGDVAFDSMPPKGLSLEKNILEQRIDRIDSTLVKLQECLADSDREKAVTIRKEMQRLKMQKKRLKRDKKGKENSSNLSPESRSGYLDRMGVANTAREI